MMFVLSSVTHRLLLRRFHLNIERFGPLIFVRYDFFVYVGSLFKYLFITSSSSLCQKFPSITFMEPNESFDAFKPLSGARDESVRPRNGQQSFSATTHFFLCQGLPFAPIAIFNVRGISTEVGNQTVAIRSITELIKTKMSSRRFRERLHLDIPEVRMRRFQFSFFHFCSFFDRSTTLCRNGGILCLLARLRLPVSNGLAPTTSNYSKAMYFVLQMDLFMCLRVFVQILRMVETVS
jgi:hypothetical protein